MYYIGMNIKGSTVIVTGAGVRFGRSLVLRLAAEGANIAVHYHSHASEAHQTASEAAEYGITAIPIEGDLTESSQVHRLFDAVLHEFGTVDAVINSASIFFPLSIEDTGISQWQSMDALTVQAPFFLSRALYLHKAAINGRGVIVNITDSSIRHPSRNRIAYSCAKAALESQTKLLAATLAPHLRVNAVAPGFFKASSEEDEQYGRRLRTRLPLKTFASERDMLEAVLFFLQNESVTGVVLPVDCGEHLL